MKRWFALILIVVLTACGQSNFLRQKHTNLKPIKSSYNACQEGEELTEVKAEQHALHDPIILQTLPELGEDVFNLEDDCGDQLTFKSGAFLKVKIVLVNKSDIVYRRCDDLNGPAYTVVKDDLAEAKLKDGTRLDLGDRTTPEKTEAEKIEEEQIEQERFELTGKEKPIEPLALVAFILALTGFFWFLAIGFGIASLVIQKNNPDSYRKSSKTFAILGIVMPLAIMLLVVGIILLVNFF